MPIPKWVKLSNNLLVIGILATVLLLLAVAGHFIASSVTDTEVTQTTVTQTTKEGSSTTKVDTPKTAIQKSSSDEIPASRKVLGWLIAAVVLGGFIAGAYASRQEKVAWYKQPFWYGVMGITVYAIIAINVLLSFLLPKIWDLFWDDQILFWSANIGLIVLVRFFSMVGKDGKPIKAARTAGFLFGLILIVGLSAQIIQNKNWGDRFSGLYNQATSSFGQPNPSRFSPTMGGAAQMEVALAVIADCETGGGVAGGAKHYFDEAKKIPMRNPQDGAPGTGAVGKLQINLSDPAIKKLVTEKGWDVENNPAHNWAAGEYLYERYDTAPWNASRGCWGPKLQDYSDGGIITIVKAAPVGEFSPWVDISDCVRYDWGKSEGSFIVENENGFQAKFDPQNGMFENLPTFKDVQNGKHKLDDLSLKLRFKTLHGSETAKVVLELTGRP